MFSKSIVAAVVCRNSHNRSRSVSRQYIIANPNGNSFARKRINGIRTAEYAGYATVGDSFAFGTFFCPVKVSLYLCFLRFGSQQRNQLTFRSQYHKRYTEHRIGTGSKDGKFQIAVFYLEAYFRTLRATNPVTLGFFQRFRPVDRIKPVEQTLCIRRHAQTPLTHFFLHHRITATHRYTVYHFIVSQYRSQLRTPVYHRFTQVSNTVVHQSLLLFFFSLSFPFISRKTQFFTASNVQSLCSLLFKGRHQLSDRTSLLLVIIIITIEHFLECPLRPMIIPRFAGTDFAVPIETEPYFI